jgi:hypothetical protein
MVLGESSRRVRDRLVIGRSSVRIRPRAPFPQVNALSRSPCLHRGQRFCRSAHPGSTSSRGVAAAAPRPDPHACPTGATLTIPGRPQPCRWVLRVVTGNLASRGAEAAPWWWHSAALIFPTDPVCARVEWLLNSSQLTRCRAARLLARLPDLGPQTPCHPVIVRRQPPGGCAASLLGNRSFPSPRVWCARMPSCTRPEPKEFALCPLPSTSKPASPTRGPT